MTAEPADPPAADASTIAVAQVLDLLDGRFRSFATGFYRQRYALWLGSGISRCRVPGLPELVLRALEHLRGRADFDNETCPFAKAFHASLDLASLSELEKPGIDIASPVQSWAIAGVVSKRLTAAYSALFNIQVDGEAADYLLWNALDVVGVYASDGLKPDCEHLCIALLVLDSSVQSIVSANWDGLIESAVLELAGPAADQALGVCVLARDLQEEQGRATMYKIHGCAVLAKENEADYRSLLIGRVRQIAGWPAGLSSDAAKARLIDLARTKRTFMVGLSAQDSNIQFIFGQDAEKGIWSWPCDPPSHVFAEQSLGNSQRLLLQLAYGDAYDDHRDEIEVAALLQAFAKPVLVALVLDLLTRKVISCLDAAAGWDDERRVGLTSGVLRLRDLAATAADGDRLDFVRLLIAHVSRAVAYFKDGQAPAPDCATYRPLYPAPLAQIENDPDLVASGLVGLAAALGVIGVGSANAHWEVQPTDLGEDGVLRLSASSAARVYLAANQGAAAELISSAIDPDGAENTVVINSFSPIQRQTRSPGVTIGRVGGSVAHEVGMSDLLDECTSMDQLVQRMREEVGV